MGPAHMLSGQKPNRAQRSPRKVQEDAVDEDEGGAKEAEVDAPENSAVVVVKALANGLGVQTKDSAMAKGPSLGKGPGQSQAKHRQAVRRLLPLLLPHQAKGDLLLQRKSRGSPAPSLPPIEGRRTRGGRILLSP